MTTRQLILLIGATTVLALTLAWIVERAQVRSFVQEFEPRLREDWRSWTPDEGSSDGPDAPAN